MDGMDRVRALVRGRDLALGYALLVSASCVVLFSGEHPRRVVLAASTNLDNLHHHPLVVLVVSAFVLQSPWGLWVLPLLVWAYGAAQRWRGRATTVLVAGAGHVLATVVVALLLATGVAQHVLDHRLTHEPDVGVSYGLAAVLGLLVQRLPRHRRRLVAVAGTVALVVTALVSETFTDLGHLLAWDVGLALGWLLAGRDVGAPAPAEV